MNKISSDIYKIKNFNLTDLYDYYINKDGITKELYGTLYKMYGGKKIVTEYSNLLEWFVRSLYLFHEGYLKCRLKEIETERKIRDINSYNKDALIKERNRYLYKILEMNFESCLSGLSNVIEIKAQTSKDDTFRLKYEIKDKNNLVLIKNSVILLYNYGYGSIHTEIINILITMLDKEFKEIYTENKIRNLMNDISFIFNNTKLKFSNK